MILRLVVLCALLAGCNTVQVPREVLVEVPIPCVTTKPTPPKLHTDSALRKASEGDYVLMVSADRLASRGYVRQLERMVDGCAAIPP